MESETFTGVGSDCSPLERKFHVYCVHESVKEIEEVMYNNDKSWR